MRAVITAMPGCTEIVAATDADEPGEELADGIKESFQDCR
jgi:5S rRNA maturation endonuclease (ribonuclease M5)